MSGLFVLFHVQVALFLCASSSRRFVILCHSVGFLFCYLYSVGSGHRASGHAGAGEGGGAGAGGGSV